jgi:hypothetical protein
MINTTLHLITMTVGLVILTAPPAHAREKLEGNASVGKIFSIQPNLQSTPSTDKDTPADRRAHAASIQQNKQNCDAPRAFRERLRKDGRGKEAHDMRVLEYREVPMTTQYVSGVQRTSMHYWYRMQHVHLPACQGWSRAGQEPFTASSVQDMDGKSGQRSGAKLATEEGAVAAQSSGTTAASEVKRPSAMSAPASTCEDRHARCQQQYARRCSDYSEGSAPWKQCMGASYCEPALKSCIAQRDALERAVAEVERTGGPKPPKCPDGMMTEPVKNSRVGAFKCFGGAAPADFKCPPGLERRNDTGMVACLAPRQ